MEQFSLLLKVGFSLVIKGGNGKNSLRTLYRLFFDGRLTIATFDYRRVCLRIVDITITPKIAIVKRNI